MIVIGIDHENGVTFSRHLLQTDMSDVGLYEYMKQEGEYDMLDEILIIERDAKSGLMQIRSIDAMAMEH